MSGEDGNSLQSGFGWYPSPFHLYVGTPVAHNWIGLTDTNRSTGITVFYQVQLFVMLAPSYRGQPLLSGWVLLALHVRVLSDGLRLWWGPFMLEEWQHHQISAVKMLLVLRLPTLNTKCVHLISFLPRDCCPQSTSKTTSSPDQRKQIISLL